MANLGRARELAQVGGGGLLRGSQLGHIAQISGHRIGHVFGHGLVDDAFGLIRHTHDRQCERAGAPSGLVLPLQQRPERALHPRPVARNRLAQREPPECFVARSQGQRLAVIGLRGLVIAHQIVRQPAVSEPLGIDRAGFFGFLKERDRGDRVGAQRIGSGKPGLRPRTIGPQRIGALEKPDRRLDIAELKRSPPGSNQRLKILRIARQQV